MEIEYKITENDYAKAVRLASTATKIQLICLFLLALPFLFLAIFAEYTFRFIGIFGLVCGILGYYITLYVVIPWRVKQQYRKYKLLHGEISLEVDDEGYKIKSSKGKNIILWSDLLKWRENKDYILLFFAPKLFHMIPKKLSESGLNINNLRQALHGQLGSAT